jgi:molybdopterin molybdotransferase
MQTNLDYQTARDLLLEQVKPLERLERVSLFQATGRVLAEDVFAIGDVPPFDRSPYDGYAFRAEDTQGASQDHPVTLRILEEVPAGSMWTQTVTAGTATKILTGAPVPPGADAVTKYEDTEFTAESVTLFAESKSGDNIVPRGEDVVKGQLLARKGTIIDSALLGTLAAQGVVEPLCYHLPVVGIITTGSELVEAGEALSGGKIVNTNQYTFYAALAHAGCQPVVCGAPGDDPEAIAQAMEKALETCDMVITTGGVSVGDYDFTPDAMERTGAEVLIRTLKLKPGGASAYGKRDGKLICSLSGNPASALVNFYAVVLPALRKLRGLFQPELVRLVVTLEEDFRKKSPKTRLIRGTMNLSDGTARMKVDQGQGNGVLHSLIGCSLLAEIPAGSPKLPAGTRLEAYLIP